MTNIDYSKSAVNLSNSVVLSVELDQLQNLEQQGEAINNQISSLIPQALIDMQDQNTELIAKKHDEIKLLIETCGSYQNLEKGWYGIKQRKVSKSYNALEFEKNYPSFAPAVIIKAVNTTALNGLIKGGLITEDHLKGLGITEEKETFQYIIKV
jgi:hypothetical protein